MNRAKEKAKEIADKWADLARRTGSAEEEIKAKCETIQEFGCLLYDAGYAQGHADANSVTRDTTDLEARV